MEFVVILVDFLSSCIASSHLLTVFVPHNLLLYCPYFIFPAFSHHSVVVSYSFLALPFVFAILPLLCVTQPAVFPALKPSQNTTRNAFRAFGRSPGPQSPRQPPKHARAIRTAFCLLCCSARPLPLLFLSVRAEYVQCPWAIRDQGLQGKRSAG